MTRCGRTKSPTATQKSADTTSRLKRCERDGSRRTYFLPGGFSGRAPGGFSGRAPGGFSGRAPGGFSGRAPGGFSGRMPGGFSGRAPGGFSGRMPGGFSGRVCANAGTALVTNRSPSAVAIEAFLNIFFSNTRIRFARRIHEVASPTIRVSNRRSANIFLRQHLGFYDKETT